MSGDVPSPRPLSALPPNAAWDTIFQPHMPYGVTINFRDNPREPSLTVMTVSQVYAQQAIDSHTMAMCATHEAIANLMETVVNQNLMELQEQLLKVAEGIDEHLRRGRGG